MDSQQGTIPYVTTFRYVWYDIEPLGTHRTPLSLVKSSITASKSENFINE